MDRYPFRLNQTGRSRRHGRPDRQNRVSAADAIAAYDGSGGGTGFDLDESGYDWIQYIKVEGTSDFSGGEIDAFSDVAAVPVPGAVWLMITGLLGLVGIRRKK